MQVRMLIHVSGGRNGVPWPPAGATIELSDAEAVDLIRAEIAVPWGKDAEKVAKDLAEQPTPGHPSKLDSRPQSQIEGEELARKAAAEQGDPVAVASSAEPPGELQSLAPDVADTDEAGGEADAGGDGAAEPAEAAEPPGPSASVPDAPGPSAPKQAWIDYAVNVRGADVHAASQMTKADLMSRYGGRL